MSYAHEDSERCAGLVARLSSRGIEPLYDALLDPGPSYPPALQRFIRRADAVLILISPDFLGSPACLDELGQAEILKKKIVPLTVRDVDDDDALSPAVRLAHRARSRTTTELDQSFDTIVDAILKDWDLAAVHSSLAEDAEEWRRRERSPALLLRGEALREAEEWLPKVSAEGVLPRATPLQTEFILASGRARKRLFARIGLIAFAVVVSLAVLALFLERSRRESEERRQVALSRKLIVDARTLDAASPAGLPTASLLAAESHLRFPNAEADAFLRERAMLLPELVRRVRLRAMPASFFFDAARTRLVTMDGERTIDVHDLRTGLRVRTIRADGPGIVALAPDGAIWLAGDDGIVRRWESRSAAETRFRVTAPNADIIWSPAASYVAAIGSDGGGTVYRSSSGAAILLHPQPRGVRQIAFRNDERSVAILQGNATIGIWSLPGGVRVAQLRVPGAREIALAPGDRVMFVATGGSVLAVDVSTGGTSTAANASGERLSVSPGGDAVAFSDADALRAWTSGEELLRRPVAAAVMGQAFLDDRTLAVVSVENLTRDTTDALLTVWRANRPATAPVRDVPRKQMTPRPDARVVAYSADRTLMAVSEGMRLRVVRTSGGREEQAFALKSQATRVAFSADSRHILILYGAGVIEVINRRKGSVQEIYQSDFIEPGAAAFDPTGALVAVGDVEGTIRVWHHQDRTEVARIRMRGRIDSLRFSRDGTTLVAVATTPSESEAATFHVHARDVVAAACRGMLRPLDDDEWKHFLGGEPRRDTCAAVTAGYPEPDDRPGGS